MPTITMQPQLVCNLCGSSQSEVRYLVAAASSLGPLHICDGCVTLMHDLITEELDEVAQAPAAQPPPAGP